MLEKSPDDKIREVFEERFQHYSTSDTTSFTQNPQQIKELMFKWFVIPDRRVAGDADYIRSIRNGEVEYDALMTQVDGLMFELETAKNNTKLPRTPDSKTIEEEVVSIIKDYLL